ncbi:LacI family DNA-binding transcriptional regulator [Nocardioides zeae]|uniref:LacI family DNA-binding transcriptional regulator n=1 Tax=Nocardioides imazamoxiresistens TaxID=3231893 RepID=A0ABU3PST5_9ACTN|nr:LacI family DNA-binding transcriptional regulator [Nocardioides zeae]MDT9592283.1 LacI family DNA-binding transcriptional regulator [Nocardioides zeae]
MSRPQRVTLADVARAAGVDVSLVSRVLRGHDVKVLDETKQRIHDQARELGYRPNAIARSLRSAKAGAFGLVIPNFSNPVYAQIIEGAEAAAARRGSVVMTSSGEGWERRAWYEALDSGRVDGLLVAGGSAVELESLRVPYLLVNRSVPGVHRHLVLDDEGAAAVAVRHLLDLGHRHIAFVGGPSDADTASRRAAGFRAEVDSVDGVSGVELRGDYTAAGGRAAVAQVVDTAVTGVVAANLPSGIGALEGLRDAGVDVPRDASVVAVHDAEIAEYVVPRLTTVRMPLRRLGARGIELLTTLSPTDEVAEVVDAPTELVVRDSTGPVR